MAKEASLKKLADDQLFMVSLKLEPKSRATRQLPTTIVLSHAYQKLTVGFVID